MFAKPYSGTLVGTLVGVVFEWPLPSQVKVSDVFNNRFGISAEFFIGTGCIDQSLDRQNPHVDVMAFAN